MSTASEGVRRYSRFFKKQSALRVLDYGTGTMRNAIYLSREGFHVVAADLPDQVARLSGAPALEYVERLLPVEVLAESHLNVDVVLSTYVFNIIMDHASRDLYVRNIVANLRPGGYLLMETRCPRLSERCSLACHDYFTSTCSKTLTHEELDALFNPYGMRRISHYYRSHAVVAMYRKNPTLLPPPL
ncbi:class I SAM-dependent methyltransferase [Geomonas sp. Red32]|uniref:class I SAM-dependent methyltransferase n=1 Tax=Geomonas sp. Red32 TaxID=2912856 RepID=UPI00202D07B3|nr:methyltransferase domain-containing protein [Geomonas sp. Red32]MCM0081447.1 class I SAM-dependent methyltransferase [Geomonas sp. Red32]